MIDTRHEDYQWVIDGRTVPVGELTPEQALSALCDCIDTIEEIDSAISDTRRIVLEWREL
jgi:hypothetical protein